ncbi:hypothetical protein AB0K60_21395 [Thermopolyspora sp. NPDC052614]|uniref:hypothetical protein n=1 Tax=Thermopolyspora sp. NPDC052614 TaxID=3155682 RepID=UPI0034386A3D
MSRKYWAGAAIVAATLTVFAQPALASAESCCRAPKGAVSEVEASTNLHPKAVVTGLQPKGVISAMAASAAVAPAGDGCFWGCKIN